MRKPNSYLVMNMWNMVIAYFDDLNTAQKCARANNGHIVFIK